MFWFQGILFKLVVLESKAMVHTSPLPPGRCWWPCWEHWAALGVSSKAGAGSVQQAEEAGCHAAGIPACWKAESRFLRRAGSASAPSTACVRPPGCRAPVFRDGSKVMLGGFSPQCGMQPSRCPEDAPRTGLSCCTSSADHIPAGKWTCQGEMTANCKIRHHTHGSGNVNVEMSSAPWQ